MTVDLLEVGRITKAHGLRGDVLVLLWSDVADRLAPGSTLDADGRALVVASSRPYQDRVMVHFVGVDDRTAADALRGVVLRAEPVEVDDVLLVHELIGCAVETVDGTHVGTVELVEANPASDLLVFEDGRLVPLTFLVSHVANKTIVIDPPAGLLD
jgi:16S rRNA processing protein RimM